jgi:general secretion pathway protein D
MKTIIKIILAAALSAGTFQTFAQDDALARLRAQRAQEQQQLGGQPADNAPAATPAPDVAAPATPAADGATPALAQDQNTDYIPSTSTTLSTNGITFNFRNAPLESVLTYMSDAAGFIIVLNTPVRGTVNVISTHPMTRDEAVDLLNTVLNQNGLAAIRDGRTLTVMSKADAIHNDIPVMIGNVSAKIPKNAEIVTQIIPVRFVDAEQLLVDLSAFVSPQATIVANQSGNSIIITDTQVNIRHLTKIIQSIDSSAESETSIQVFPLKYANPNDVVATLSGIFPSNTSNPTTVGGRGGRGGGGGFGGGFGGGNPFAAMFAGAAGNTGGSSQARVQKAQQVLAVADGRTQSVVVTAAKDMMPQISDMIAQLDIDSTRDQDVSVITVKNADPYEAAQVLQKMFGGTTAQNGSTTPSVIGTRATQALPATSGGTTTGGSTRGGGGF